MTSEAHSQRADARRNRDVAIDAAMELLARKPDASMRDVADAADLGRTTLYRHFPAREDLIFAIFERIFEEGRAITAQAIAEGGTPADILRRATHAREELATEMTPEWIFQMTIALVIRANEEMQAGHVDQELAGRLLGDTLVRAFT
jgi:AcrR family transcriptional regulator